VPRVYDALAEAFGVQLSEPLTLRVHPSRASYLQSNPLLVETDGMLAGSRRGRREIEIVVPPVGPGSDVAIDNAVRREVARLLATEASDDRLPDGLLDGVARFLEQPGDADAAEVARLRDSFSRGALYHWSDMASPGSAYLDPRVAAPEGRSIIHFLVERYGFSTLLRFLGASSDAASWRIALEAAYGVAPDKLETAWLAWLPAYLDGGWRRHPLYAPDLTVVEQGVRAGEFASAEDVLAAAVPLLQTASPELGARAGALLEQARDGSSAVAQLAEAAAALDAGDYARAAASAAEAKRSLEALGQADAAAAAAEVARRAQVGLTASADYRWASGLPAWRATEARVRAAAAAAAFAELGNDAAADRAEELVARVDGRLLPAGYSLLALAVILMAWNLRRRLADRQRVAERST
jgi:Arc/MetJ-type ribon-helix-helix transcriptional regulator